ncbi:MAG: LCP family protein [Anaerolineae bacterium]|nr:LCP family protein [Anaerolineae bacterium]
MKSKPAAFITLSCLLLLVALQACSMPVFQQDTASAAAPASPVIQPNQQATSSNVYVTVAPDASATPTPFRPLPQTPTPQPTNTPTPTLTPTLSISDPQGEMPQTYYPVQSGGPLPDGVVNILVMGSDARPGGGFRTDVIVLVSINRNNNTVSMVSFPRDLYINIPGWMTNRINTAMAAGGFYTMASVFEANFGVRPNYYVMTNMEGFIGIVDSLDGITVKVRQSLHDKCDLPWADGAGYCTIDAPAAAPMDGKSALWYVRSRYSSSDFDRLRRAQEVLQGLFNKLMSIDGVTRAPEIYQIYRDNVETNLSVDEILPLIPVAQEVLQNPDRIRRFTITPAEAYPYITPEGAWVLWPNLDAIRSIVYQAVYQ